MKVICHHCGKPVYFHFDDPASIPQTATFSCPHCNKSNLIRKTEANTGPILFICRKCRAKLRIPGNSAGPKLKYRAFSCPRCKILYKVKLSDEESIVR